MIDCLRLLFMADGVNTKAYASSKSRGLPHNSQWVSHWRLFTQLVQFRDEETRTAPAIFSLKEILEVIRENGSRSTRSSPGIWLPFRQQRNIQEVKLMNKKTTRKLWNQWCSCNKKKNVNDSNRIQEPYSNLYIDLTAVVTVHTGKSTK
jgi:hypothetical protein